MKILKAIGSFFERIWRWIKETAWIQPLLIVGVIFALIFSIPYFTSWISSLGVGSSNYYTAFKQTLEGERDSNSSESSSQADAITYNIAENSNFDGDNSWTMNDYTADYAKYGYKFFLVYVSEDCANCETIQEGFEALEDNWGTLYKPTATQRTADGEAVVEPFKIYTIFTDESSSNDDEDIMDDKTAFQRYLNIHSDFFESSGQRFLDYTPYKRNASVSETNYNYWSEVDPDNFTVPTIVLVDYTYQATRLLRSGDETSPIVGRQGASEIAFGISGDTKYDRAEVLLNMWNHTDTSDTSAVSYSVSAVNNPFSESYRAS